MAAHHISLHLDPQFLSSLSRMSDDESRNIDLAHILNLVQGHDGDESETQVQAGALDGDVIVGGGGIEAQNASAIIRVRLGGSVSDNQDSPVGIPQRTGGAAHTNIGAVDSAGGDMENELGEEESHGNEEGDVLAGVEELSDEIDMLLEGLLMREAPRRARGTENRIIQEIVVGAGADVVEATVAEASVQPAVAAPLELDVPWPGPLEAVLAEVMQHVMARRRPRGQRGYIGNPGDYLDGRGLDSFLDHLAETENPNRGPPPAAKSAIANLAIVRVVHGDGEDSETNLCAICKEMGEEGEEMSQMPCAHLYHPDCILAWLSSRNSFPVCRHELPTDDDEYEARKGANRSTSAGATIGSEQLVSKAQNTDAEEDAPTGPGGTAAAQPTAPAGGQTGHVAPAENGWEREDPERQAPNSEAPADRMRALAPTESGNFLSAIRTVLKLASFLVAIFLFQGRTGGQTQDSEQLIRQGQHPQRRRFFGLF